MGSDLSYEDLLEDPALRRMYEAAVVGEEVVTDRPCWVLVLDTRGGGMWDISHERYGLTATAFW